jgi:hypothetical protein
MRGRDLSSVSGFIMISELEISPCHLVTFDIYYIILSKACTLNNDLVISNKMKSLFLKERYSSFFTSKRPGI